MRNYKQEFYKLLHSSPAYNPLRLFHDFCRMSAISIHQAVNFEPQREQEYLQIVKQYNEDTVNMFPELLGLNTLALEDNPEHDFLGEVFHVCEFHNSLRGQFFTPYPLCTLIAGAICADVKQQLVQQKYISISEPACGAGAMLIAVRNLVIQQGINLNTQILMIAADIDRLCADMCYIQLSLLGVPAVVHWGNTITCEVWDSMYTPIYKVFAWDSRMSDHAEDRTSVLAENLCIDEELPPHSQGQFVLF